MLMPDLSHGEQYFDSRDNVSTDPNCDITQQGKERRRKGGGKVGLVEQLNSQLPEQEIDR